MSAVKTVLSIIGHLLMFVLLTVITQVGGLIYLLCLLLFAWRKIGGLLPRMVIFAGVYLLLTQVVIPPLAKSNNRVPMPVMQEKSTHVKPHSIWLALACRHYVRPELKEMILSIAEEMQEPYPGVYIEYLDGSFPFFNSFRMLPHLRHDDGTKLDLSFVYKNKKGAYSNGYFSLFGYGFAAKATEEEVDMTAICEEKGHKQYGMVERLVPDQEGKGYEFAMAENATLLRKLSQHPSTFFIFLEPHLKFRLGLMTYHAIRFHGCWAVRHDDHMHVQIKK